MAKNRHQPAPLSNRKRQQQLRDAKARRKQAEEVALARRNQERESQSFERSLAASRKYRKTSNVIDEIWNGGGYTTQTYYLWEIFRHFVGYTSNSERALLPADKQESLAIAKEVLQHLEDVNCKIFDRPATEVREYTTAICNLVKMHQKWLRPIKEWKPPTKNATRQFADLARHLLAKYDIPIFMDEAWMQTGVPKINWWIHIAQGGNIRTAPDFTVPMTKMMAHHMMQAPSDFPISAAVRWGQIHALGGNERICRAIRDNAISRDSVLNQFPAVHDFWLSVFRWFIANPMLDPVHLSPICDYLFAQKYTIQNGAPGPIQPNLTMKDRDANTLLRNVEEWHERLQREGRAMERKKNSPSWEHHTSIKDFEVEMGPQHNRVVYKIVQLLTTKDLFAEGARLRHCVGSYSWSCASGRVSIWSARRMTGNNFDLLGTIEIDNANRRIVQFRAKNNDKPPEQAYKMVNLWAGQNQLSIGTYL